MQYQLLTWLTRKCLWRLIMKDNCHCMLLCLSRQSSYVFDIVQLSYLKMKKSILGQCIKITNKNINHNYSIFTIICFFPPKAIYIYKFLNWHMTHKKVESTVAKLSIKCNMSKSEWSTSLIKFYLETVITMTSRWSCDYSTIYFSISIFVQLWSVSESASNT